MCEQIVIPNIRLRDDLEEMFEMNWVEYVRRDTEGGDTDTRRRAATDLVKALTTKFEVKVYPYRFPLILYTVYTCLQHKACMNCYKYRSEAGDEWVIGSI